MPDFPGLRCPLCGDSMDVFGDHCLACSRSGFTQRHSALVSFLWHLATAASLSVKVEVGVGTSTRPGDIEISHWKGQGPLDVDVSVVHPLNPSVPYGSVKSGHEAVEEAEQGKRRKHGPTCAAAKVSFEPFGVSTFGILGNSASALFKDIIALLQAATKEERAALETLYGQQLQLALKRDIARMLLQGAHLEVPRSPDSVLEEDE